MLKACPQIEVIESPTLKEKELLEKLKGCDALVVRSQTQVSKAVLQGCPTVRAVGRAGVEWTMWMWMRPPRKVWW